MIDKDAILAALGRLDPANDEHWTAQGLPAIKALEDLAGGTGLTRAAVEEAAPGFTRTVATAASDQGEKQEVDPPPLPAPPALAETEQPLRAPFQPDPEEVARALNSLDPAILRAALKQVPAEVLAEPPAPPEPPLEPVTLSEANAHARTLDAERVENERRVKQLLKDALKEHKAEG